MQIWVFEPINSTLTRLDCSGLVHSLVSGLHCFPLTFPSTHMSDTVNLQKILMSRTECEICWHLNFQWQKKKTKIQWKSDTSAKSEGVNVEWQGYSVIHSFSPGVWSFEIILSTEPLTLWALALCLQPPNSKVPSGSNWHTVKTKDRLRSEDSLKQGFSTLLMLFFIRSTTESGHS